MAEFVLGNNYFKFFDKIYQKTSGTNIGTKLAHPSMLVFLWAK